MFLRNLFPSFRNHRTILNLFAMSSNKRNQPCSPEPTSSDEANVEITSVSKRNKITVPVEAAVIEALTSPQTCTHSSSVATTSSTGSPKTISSIYFKKDETFKIQRLNPDAKLPTRGSPLAAGYDLYSCEEITILSKERGMVSTGLAIKVPSGTYGRVAPRSGLSVKHGIETGAGVIDEDYTGEVKVILFNHDKKDFTIKKGDRIAQIVLERISTPDIEEVDSLTQTARGKGGFGSTGSR